MGKDSSVWAGWFTFLNSNVFLRGKLAERVYPSYYQILGVFVYLWPEVIKLFSFTIS